jgi:hypothetical protein
MNNGAVNRTITNFNDLLDEKQRLEMLIENQKNIVRHDFDELKGQFKKEIKPALDAAAFVKKVAKPTTRNETVLRAAAGIVLDLALRKLLFRSNFLVQLLIPKIAKNYASHLLSSKSTKVLPGKAA